MATRQFTVGPFLGPVSSVDPRFLQNSVASDVRNVRIEDGKLLPRYGYRTLSAAPTGTFIGFGFDFTRGFDTNRDLVEEYISIESRGGIVTPVSIDPLSGTRVSITHAGSAVQIPSGVWHSRPYDNVAFCWAQGGSAYFHNLGDSDHFRLVDTAIVADPVSGSLQVDYSNPETIDIGSLTNPDSTKDWDGADSGTISQWEDGIDGDPRTKTFVSENNSTMVWDLAETEHVESVSFAFMEIDFSTLVAGNPDWSDKGVFRMKITHNQGTSSFRLTTAPTVTFRSAAGSSIPMTVNFQQVVNRDSNNLVTDTELYITVAYPQGANKSLMSSVRYWQMYLYFYSMGMATTREDITFHAIQIWDEDPSNPSPSEEPHEVKFGLTFSKSEWGIESENVKESASVYMDYPSRFFTGEGTGAVYLGNVATIALEDPDELGDEDIDEIKLWFKDMDDGIWRLITTTTYSTGGYLVPYNYAELLEGTARSWQAYRPTGAIRWATPYSGSMVWLKAGAKDNVEISAVGEPKNLWNSSQTSEERGALMSMSPALDDEPVWANAAGESLIVLGSRGAYASVGLRPIEMTPFKKLPGSKGVIGSRAAARWKDDGGNPGVAYLGTDQEIWFAVVTPGFNGEQGFLLQELTLNVRGLVRSFLTQSDTPVVSGLSLAVDERSDSLWLTYLDRGMVLRRPSLVDGQRHWELYDYAGSWQLLAEDPIYGLRAMDASGRVDELEYDSSNGFAFIGGANRDAGTPVSNIYWKSKLYSDVRRRVRNLRIEREDTSTTVEVDVIADRQTETVTVPAGKKNANVGYKTQGESVQFKLKMAETDGAIVQMSVEEATGVSSRRDR